MVNAAQAKQGDSELFLALAWPKQLSGNPKGNCTHNNPKPGGEQKQPINQGKKNSLISQIGKETYIHS